jgi:hypothetical protein
MARIGSDHLTKSGFSLGRLTLAFEYRCERESGSDQTRLQGQSVAEVLLCGRYIGLQKADAAQKAEIKGRCRFGSDCSLQD